MLQNSKLEAAQKVVDQTRKQVFAGKLSQDDLAAAERIRDFFLKKS